MNNHSHISRTSRVVHLTSAHPPSDVRIFVKECRSLSKAGYEVILVAPHDCEQVVDGVRIIGIAKLDRRLQRMTSAVWQVYRMALRLDADLYHFHDPELIIVGLLLKAHSKRVVYDIHEDVPRDVFLKPYLSSFVKPPLSWIVERWENFAARQFSGLVAATPAISMRFQALNPSTVAVCNYPVHDELMPSQIAWKDRAHSVAYVGNCGPVFGVAQIVEAMGYIKDDLPCTLELAGRFSSSEYRERVMKLKGWERVNERGYQSRPEVANILGRVWAGLAVHLPDQNAIQSWPNKLFEYMSAGIPIVVSDFPNRRDLISQVECGLLVDPLDPRSIAGAIEYVFTHPEEAEAMGRRGREAVEKHYNWESEFSKLLQLYEGLLQA